MPQDEIEVRRSKRAKRVVKQLEDYCVNDTIKDDLPNSDVEITQ